MDNIEVAMRINERFYLYRFYFLKLHYLFRFNSKKLNSFARVDCQEKPRPLNSVYIKFLRFFILCALSFNFLSRAEKCKSVFSDLYVELKLPIHIVNLLNNSDISNLQELVIKAPQDLLKLPGFGLKSLLMVEQALEKKSLSLVNSDLDLYIDISVLNLSVRPREALLNEGIVTLEELISKTPRQLLGIRNLGLGSVVEIEQALAKRNLSLKALPQGLDSNDISILDISIRSQNALRDEGIHTVDKLMSKIPKELLKKIISKDEQN